MIFKDCKYVYIIDSYDKVVDDEGYLYCVSTSDDSYDELIDERDRFEDSGKICVLGGNYNNGGAVGVQYEVKGWKVYSGMYYTAEKSTGHPICSRHRSKVYLL